MKVFSAVALLALPLGALGSPFTRIGSHVLTSGRSYDHVTFNSGRMEFFGNTYDYMAKCIVGIQFISMAYC